MNAPHARIVSVESGASALVAWIMASVFAAAFLGAFLVAVFAGRGWIGPVVAGLLLAFAIGWLYSLSRTSRSLARHGEAYLELAAPAAPGETLQGTVHFEKGVGGLSRLVATLDCTLWLSKGATTTKPWSAQQVVEVVRAGESAEARIRFDIPRDAPRSHLPPAIRGVKRTFGGEPVRKSEEFFVWELSVSSGMRGHDIERHFRVPVGEDARQPDASGLAADTPAPKPGLVPVIALVAANLVPIAGVVYFGWKVRDIVMLYWLENLVIGAYNVLRLLSLASSPLQSRLGLATFFTVHYGGFCAFHGIFLAFLFADKRAIDILAPSVDQLAPDVSLLARVASPLFDILGNMPRDPVVGAALFALIASHGISFVLNHFVRGERHRIEPGLAMMRPYGRIVVTHMSVLAGGMLLTGMKEPMAALLLFIGLKTLLDLGSHAWEHSGRRASVARR